MAGTKKAVTDAKEAVKKATATVQAETKKAAEKISTKVESKKAAEKEEVLEEQVKAAENAQAKAKAAEPAKTAAAKTEGPKKAEKAAEKRAEEKEEKKPAAKKTRTRKTPVKRTPRKAAAKEKTEVKRKLILQYDGEYDLDAITAQAIEEYKADGTTKADVESINLYIKPEDRAVYYVINESYAGKVSF